MLETNLIVLLLQLLFAVLTLISFQGGLKGLYYGVPKIKTVNVRTHQVTDNVYRFMAGMHLGVGLICLWVCITMNQQNTLVYLLAFTVFLAGIGRVISISSSGTSNKRFYWYTAVELMLPIIIVILQYWRD